MLDLWNLISEYHGVELSLERKEMFSMDLQCYSTQEIMSAWAAYRLKNSKLPMPKDLIEHIQDGRPSAQEAWGMIPRSEAASVIWTEEMRLAYGACVSLINEGQITNAFFVFKEKYDDLIRAARVRKERAKWSPSFGYDQSGRLSALKEAVSKGRLSIAQANQFLPEFQEKRLKPNSSFAKIGDAIKLGLKNQETSDEETSRQPVGIDRSSGENDRSPTA